MSVDEPWKDEEVLRRLYIEQDLTQKQVANRLGCCSSTVQNWLGHFEISTPSPKEYTRVEYAHFRTHPRGYEVWTDNITGQTVFVHKLVLIAAGNSPYDVFQGNDSHSHHRNAIPWDNRPENLERLSREDHSHIHREKGDLKTDHFKDAPWRDAGRLREMYVEQRLRIRDIAEKLGCSEKTISDWLKKHGIDTRKPSEVHHSGDRPWQDEQRLREAYQDATTQELADRWGCSQRTVMNWIQRFGIETRDPVAEVDC